MWRETPEVTMYWTLTAKGNVKAQKTVPKKAVFCKEVSQSIETQIQINPDSECDEDDVFMPDNYSRHLLTRFEDGVPEIAAKEHDVTYHARHGYGRGPGLRNIISRVLRAEMPGNFTDEDQRQCLSEENSLPHGEGIFMERCWTCPERGNRDRWDTCEECKMSAPRSATRR